MPSQHVPEKGLLQTLRKKVATGRATAMKGRVGRELTEEEKRQCAEQLAALEAMVVGELDPQFEGKVPVTLERYWAKIGSDTGMTMFPVPVDMPSVPAIAPSLYSEAPQAAVIIDNLNRLEVAVADIIAYPNLDNRDELLEAVADEYTKDDVNVTDTMNYLLSALRGGIFNQGGPAIGELGQSERNRSREAMDMIHTTIMPGPQ